MLDTAYDPGRLIADRFRRTAGGPIVSANERAVLRMIWDTPGLPRAALAGRLDITQQSIHRIVTGLQARGLVTLGPLEPPAGKGKPSPRLLLNPRYGCTLGISLDTDSAGVSLMDFSGSYATERVRTAGLTVAQSLAALGAAADRLRGAARFGAQDVVGIGFAISGFLMEATRYNPPEPMAPWAEIDLGPFLSSHFGLPVWCENGANTGALCERMFGVGRDVDHFAYLSFNYGFGAGIIVGGELLTGGYGNAGEISGIYFADEAEDRPVLRTLLAMLRAHGVEVASIEDLFRDFRMDWPGVDAWLDRVTHHYNRAVQALHATVDPQAIVLGGQMPEALAEALIARTTITNPPRHGVARKEPRVLVSQIRGATSAIGAACLPLKAVFF